MQQYPVLRKWTNEGMSEAEIAKLEFDYRLNKPFPIAYREFLFLAGKHSNLEDIDTGLGYDWMQRKAKEMLAEYGQVIERPFWVTDQLDGCEQFGFFYLDEDIEDPKVYYCMPAYVSSGEPLIQQWPHKTFSALIDACVQRSIITDHYIRK